jgi:hypothetical protein
VGFPVGWLGVRLPSGKHAETSGGLLSIGDGADENSAETVLNAMPGRTYSVQYTLPNYGDSKAAELQTGEFRFRVLEKGETEGKQPILGKLKKEIAWGKPGKNGLQAGVVLMPLKAAQECDNTKK